MSSVFVLALRLGWSVRPENRWRILAIFVAALIATVSLAATVAGIRAWYIQEARDADRVPIAGATTADHILRWKRTADTIDGRQYPVVAIQLVGSDVRAPLP